MSQLKSSTVGPEIRQRNRTLVWILIAIMLGMATWGTLYLRHYGFNTSPSTEHYH